LNRLSIILPAASIALGSTFLYLGFESGAGGYVTLSIDGAFLLLVGIVSIFAPRADTAEVDYLAQLSKQVPGASEHFPSIMSGKVYAQFTRDGRVALIDRVAASKDLNGVVQVIEPLSGELRRLVLKAQTKNHGGDHGFALTRRFEGQLVDKGVLEGIHVELRENWIEVTLHRPVTGVPLLPEYREPNEAMVATLSSLLLTTICCLVSADAKRDTTLKNISRHGDELVIQLGGV
jgi:hypothetical protein